jgi:hypothetical protein
VQVAAWLHAARVRAVSDRRDAERLVERALGTAETLPESTRDTLLPTMISLTAIVSPSHALELARRTSSARSMDMTQTMFNMLQHGHVDAAIEVLAHPLPGRPYPFSAAMDAFGRAKTDETRRTVLRAAARAVLANDTTRPFQGMSGQFPMLFEHHWRLLPAEEAVAIVRDLVRMILAAPDQRTRSSFGSALGDVRFSSTHAHQLFQLLGPLRHLDQSLADTLIARHPELARAAATLPYGTESVRSHYEQVARASAPAPARPEKEPADYLPLGRRLMPIEEAIATNFNDAFVAAGHAYDVVRLSRRVCATRTCCASRARPRRRSPSSRCCANGSGWSWPRRVATCRCWWSGRSADARVARVLAAAATDDRRQNCFDSRARTAIEFPPRLRPQT